MLFKKHRRVSKEAIEKKLDSDRPLEPEEVTGAIDCALERLDNALSSSSEQLVTAARRLTNEARNLTGFPSSPLEDP